MRFFVLFLVLCFVPKFSFASTYDLTQFKNRFEIQTNAAKEKVIVDKSILENLSIEVYIKNLATYLTVSDTDFENESFACKGFEYEKPDLELSKSYAKALEWMRKTDIGKLLSDEKFLKFLKEIDMVTSQYVNDPGFVVAANLDNPTFFYKRAFAKFMQDKLKGLAEAYFGATVYLKIVTYIADDYSNFVVHKKLYHQNILFYYLENFRADELGLTESEKRRALSSLHDARLSFGFGGTFESNKIKKDFDGYGYKKLQEVDKKGEERWVKNASQFDDRLYKIESYFSEVSYGSAPMTINLGIKKDRGDERPSFTFDNDCPDFLYKNRRMFELARVALGMSPIPYSGKLFTLIKSKYQSQALSEAIYYGWLEATNQDSKKAYILKQSMNPLLN